jgi:hypothetical protein
MSALQNRNTRTVDATHRARRVVACCLAAMCLVPALTTLYRLYCDHRDPSRG